MSTQIKNAIETASEARMRAQATRGHVQFSRDSLFAFKDGRKYRQKRDGFAGLVLPKGKAFSLRLVYTRYAHVISLCYEQNPTVFSKLRHEIL